MNIIMNDQNHSASIISKLKLASHWAIDYLGIKDESVDVEIILDDMCDGLNGMIIDESDVQYDIVLDDKREIGYVIHTLFHEMVHVRQHIRDGLGMKLDSCHNIPYMEREWEIEAFTLSDIMMEKFISFINSKG